jgi:hypothetical protein
MQIALTKKLADALELKPLSAAPRDPDNDLFSWTANWVKANSRNHSEDMLVLINNATRFAVGIYQIKSKDIKKVDGDMITQAIEKTFTALHLNPELSAAYFGQAGKVEFVQNKDRQLTTHVNTAGRDLSFFAMREHPGSDKVFDDSFAAIYDHRTVGIGTMNQHNLRDSMFSELSKLAAKPIYDYKAFEIQITLDVEIYQVTRRLIVPADISFPQLHMVIQRAMGWKWVHMHEFVVLNDENRLYTRLIMDMEDMESDAEGLLEEEYVLADFFPKFKHMVYTYDFGDGWEHYIELLRVIEHYDKDSPYLLEAAKRTPPEDVGGVYGFIDFYNVLLDPENDEYQETRKWAKYWTPELNEIETRSRVL